MLLILGCDLPAWTFQDDGSRVIERPQDEPFVLPEQCRTWDGQNRSTTQFDFEIPICPCGTVGKEFAEIKRIFQFKWGQSENVEKLCAKNGGISFRSNWRWRSCCLLHNCWGIYFPGMYRRLDLHCYRNWIFLSTPCKKNNKNIGPFESWVATSDFKKRHKLDTSFVLGYIFASCIQ